MIPHHPVLTRTDNLFPYSALFRSPRRHTSGLLIRILRQVCRHCMLAQRSALSQTSITPHSPRPARKWGSTLTLSSQRNGLAPINLAGNISTPLSLPWGTWAFHAKAFFTSLRACARALPLQSEKRRVGKE